ncbi:RNA pseudouridine synthase [Brochothrix thermosphacta]|uniref:RluA family pseudouridine synthase n=1 Tax=Brochothrix thermosphacta TaxID=2756 RepID=UPI000E733092|nr:RluA family pseudouridine synthase [Brochothrix thermosphacta]ANZ94196.1 RNA pseudouridine synthase [Brochothrix thermosphacta]
MNNKLITVTEEVVDQRLDKALSTLDPKVSRTQAVTMVKEGAITVNDQVKKPKYKVQLGDVISYSVKEPEVLSIEAEDIPLDVIYEDEDVIVVNKPQGMVVHPSAGHTSGTLVNALMYHCKDLSSINGVVRPGIVHRIDKDTSGLLMVAKNDKAHLALAQELKEHKADRYYIALVHGEITHSKGTIDAPVGRSKTDRQKMAVVDHGKPAVSHFEVLEHFPAFTLVECQLETGRTHQIRVHFRYIEHPLAGDPKYGPKKTLAGEGQYLHAKTLAFTHPRTGEKMTFEAPLPQNFTDMIETLRKSRIVKLEKN